jgi:DNA-binding beta-propeller fold protein YncE
VRCSLVASLVLAVGLLLAGCGDSLLTATTSQLPPVSFQRVPGSPFGVVTTPDGRYAFVDLAQGRVLVYALSDRAPRLIHTISVPHEAIGSSLTRDGRLLLVADGDGAVVISVARAESGASDPVLGTLSPPTSTRPQASGAIETASSTTGQYVFVSLEYGNPDGVISVYDLGSDRTPHFARSDYVGSIPLGEAVVGSALSPNGRYLYVTSEIGGPGMRTGDGADGTLSVLNVKTAEHTADDRAVAATVPAMLQPVRVAVSPNGSTVWVTARASNRVLAFSAKRLLSDPNSALIAQVKVGTAPVGVAVFDHGTRLIVADSDRFDAAGANAALTILNAHDALAKHAAVIATLRAGQFPREIAIERNDQAALVTNFASDQIETVNLFLRSA